MKVELIPLSEEQIQKLPFPDTARLLGGILILKENPLENHLNVEAFRKQWNEHIKDSSTFKTPTLGETSEKTQHIRTEHLGNEVEDYLTSSWDD